MLDGVLNWLTGMAIFVVIFFAFWAPILCLERWLYDE